MGICHVARVAEGFLSAGRREGELDGDDIEPDEFGDADNPNELVPGKMVNSMTKGKGMARMWRCEMFDRVLVRYKLGWLISEPSQLREFWENFGDEEYRKDPVKTGEQPTLLSSLTQDRDALVLRCMQSNSLPDWKRITTKGIKGFSLTDAQIDEGISIRQFTEGLKEVDGEWVWDDHSSTTHR